MTEKKYICFFILLITSVVLKAQELQIIDALESPVRDVQLVNESGTTFSFSDKYGRVSLNNFNGNEKIIISHTGFITAIYSKKELVDMRFLLKLEFNSEALGEVILLTRIDDENLKTTAEKRIVLHSKEIERLNTQNTADLLEKRAGINVQKSQMGGGSPVIRGFEANRILLVVDGVRLNNAIYRGGHLQNIITVDNASLEEVEIIFGPSNSAYSSDGLGGIIHLKTKRPSFSKEPIFKHAYSSRYATANKGLSRHYDLTFRSKTVTLYSSISQHNFGDLRMGQRRGHGYEDWGLLYRYVEDGELLENVQPHIQKNTGYSQTDIMQKALLKLSDKIDLTANVQYSNSSNIPRFDKQNDYNEINYNYEDAETIYSGLKYDTWEYGPQKRLFASLQIDQSLSNIFMDSAQYIFAYQDVFESRLTKQFGDEVLKEQNENVDIYSFNLNFKKNKLLYGAEFYYNEVTSTAFLINEEGQKAPYDQTRYPNMGSDMKSWALYSTYRHSISPKLTLNTGMRYTQNVLSGNYLFKERNYTLKLPYTEIDNDYSALTGNVSLSYLPNKSWKIATIASTGFHAPNLDDVSKVFYKDSRVTVPNFNLAPEKASTIELNITKNINNQILLNANTFYTQISNAIMRVVATEEDREGIVIDPLENFTDFTINKNTGRAEIYGATASISVRIASNYTFESDYTIIKGTNLESDLPFTHIPPSFGKTAFYADFDAWRASAFILYNGRKPIGEYDLVSGTDNEEESPFIWVENPVSGLMEKQYQGTPAWYTINLSAMYRFSDVLTAQMALENILDTHYKTFASGLSAPGRNFILTLRAHF